MFDSLTIAYRELKASEKRADLIVYSFFWMVLTATAAYPSLCIDRKTEIFSPEKTNSFLLPIFLFLAGFLFDLYVATQSKEKGGRKGRLYQCMLFLLVITFVFLSFLIASNNIWIKCCFFIFVWASISTIKGLMILISLDNEEKSVVQNEELNLSQPSKGFIQGL